MRAALTANGNGPAIFWKGGAGTFAPRGTFGGGTVTMEFCPGDADITVEANWDAINNISFTAKGQSNFSLGYGHLRAVVADADSPSITYDFLPILEQQW